jgi:hypothetical protein
MGYLLYWLDPATGSSAASTAETFLNWDGSITCPGSNITLLDTDLVQHYDETLGDYVIDSPRVWSLWKASGFKPMRMAQRDDGNGKTERSAKIRTAGKEMSSSDDSNRLTHQGRGQYR